MLCSDATVTRFNQSFRRAHRDCETHPADGGRRFSLRFSDKSEIFTIKRFHRRARR